MYQNKYSAHNIEQGNFNLKSFTYFKVKKRLKCSINIFFLRFFKIKVVNKLENFNYIKNNN